MSFQRSLVQIARRAPALLTLVLLAAPLLANDCDQYDDVGFTFLQVDENGRITYDDLGQGYTYRVMACEIEPDAQGRYDLACDFDTDYFEVTTTYYQISNWDSEKIYWYGVNARTSDRCYIPGRARDYIPPDAEAVILTTPANLSIAASGAVSWDAVSNADHYLVDWRKDSDNWNTYNRSDTNSFTVPDFDATADYRVRVRGVTSENRFGPSSTVTWRPPDAPANLAIDANGDVSWDAVSNAVHYLVDWQKDQDDWNRNNQVDTTGFSIPDFDAVADYQVEVRAVGAYDAKGPAATTTRFPPETPTNLAVSDSGSVTWDAVTDADHYLVNWLKNEGDFSNNIKVTTTSFDLPDFDPGASYGVLVRAVASDGAESPAAVVTRTPPDSPSNLVIDENGQVSWSSVPGASSYIVDWRQIGNNWNEENQVDAQALAADARTGETQADAQAAAVLLAQTDDAMTYDIPGFDPTSDYEARVYAVNEDNVRSHPPATTTFEAVQPTRPTNLRIDAGGQVSWSAATQASWYHTGWRETGGSWTINTREEGTSFQIPGFDPALPYVVSVQAIIEIGESTVAGEVVYAYWRPPGFVSADGDGDNVDQLASPTANCIAPHDGTTLIVCLEHGWIAAYDHDLAVSLHAPLDCSGQTLPAYNSALSITCDAAGNFTVTQLNAQHPQDKRRDLLVFDAALSNCYRAYEYLDTGAIEVWDRGCG